MGTEITFQLEPGDGQVFVRFTHARWQVSGDFLAHCTTKWGSFLLSLKNYIETGRGEPYPDDVPIDHT